ncbi:MAG TPA: MBL fold metallo-hydrolase, partial [Isosphaeraceae bacterium]|nr:MBL fold metallo-hydrolase [Isosphaeraceae bacterium]
MKRLADDLYWLPVLPPYGVNAYLMNGVLIDAGLRGSAGRILHMLRGHTVTEHALTHAHPDHQGGSHA